MKKPMITFLFLLICSTLNAQIQMGSDIDGDAAGDSFGYRVAISADGNRMAVGAPYNDAAGNNAGHVRIFQYTEDDWSPLGSTIEGTAAANSEGYSVALSADGNRVAVTAGAANNARGQVRIFEYDGSDWSQLGSLIEGEGVGDVNGFNLSLSDGGNRIAIGAPGNSNGGAFAGQVRMFEYDGENWVQLGGTINGEGEGGLGYAIDFSVDGNRVAVGLPFKNNATGQVQIFDYVENDWTNVATMDGTSENDYLGSAVSLSADGNRLAIGAFGVDESAGEVQLFEVFFDTLWVQLSGTIKGVAADDKCGDPVLTLSDDGSRLAVGALGNDGGGMDAGHTRIFDYQNSAWTQVGIDINGEAVGDASGWGIAMSADGNRVAIGAVGNDDAGEDAGHVRVFDLSVLTAIQDLPQLSLQFYPNPVRDILHIEGEQMTGMQARILDLSGKVLLQQNLSKPEINLSELATGMYFLWLNAEQGTSIQMIVKE